MSKIKSPTLLPDTVTNKTGSITIYFDSSEAVTAAVAKRIAYTTKSGVDVALPVASTTVSLDANAIGAAIVNKLNDLNALIDAADNF